MVLRNTAAMEWEQFRRRAVHPDAPRAAVTELRAVFYAGMSSGLRMSGAGDVEPLFMEIRDTLRDAAVLTGDGWQRGEE